MRRDAACSTRDACAQLIATLKITEVMRGPHDLLGQTFEAFTSEKFMEENTYYINPALKPGELCISAIARRGDEKKELWMFSGGAFRVGEDLLPCVQGRKVNSFNGSPQDYDRLLERLRHRREHPEAYAKIEFKDPPPPPPAPAPPSNSEGQKSNRPPNSKP